MGGLLAILLAVGGSAEMGPVQTPSAVSPSGQASFVDAGSVEIAGCMSLASGGIGFCDGASINSTPGGSLTLNVPDGGSVNIEDPAGVAAQLNVGPNPNSSGSEPLATFYARNGALACKISDVAGVEGSIQCGSTYLGPQNIQGNYLQATNEVQYVGACSTPGVFNSYCSPETLPVWSWTAGGDTLDLMDLWLDAGNIPGEQGSVALEVDGGLVGKWGLVSGPMNVGNPASQDGVVITPQQAGNGYTEIQTTGPATDTNVGLVIWPKGAGDSCEFLPTTNDTALACFGVGTQLMVESGNGLEGAYPGLFRADAGQIDVSALPGQNGALVSGTTPELSWNSSGAWASNNLGFDLLGYDYFYEDSNHDLVSVAQSSAQLLELEVANSTITNLLPYSHMYASWGLLNGSVGSAVDPTGYSNADYVMDNATSGLHMLYQSPTSPVTSGATYTLSTYMAPGTNSYGALCGDTSGLTSCATYLLTGAGSVASTSGADYLASTITPITNASGISHWYLISLTFKAASSTIAIGWGTGSATSASYSGSSHTVLGWGTQLLSGSNVRPYVPTTAASYAGSNLGVYALSQRTIRASEYDATVDDSWTLGRTSDARLTCAPTTLTFYSQPGTVCTENPQVDAQASLEYVVADGGTWGVVDSTNGTLTGVLSASLGGGVNATSKLSVGTTSPTSITGTSFIAIYWAPGTLAANATITQAITSGSTGICGPTPVSPCICGFGSGTPCPSTPVTIGSTLGTKTTDVCTIGGPNITGSAANLNCTQVCNVSTAGSIEFGLANPSGTSHTPTTGLYTCGCFSYY